MGQNNVCSRIAPYFLLFIFLQLVDCLDVSSEAPVKHSTEVTFYPEKYDIV